MATLEPLILKVEVDTSNISDDKIIDAIASAVAHKILDHLYSPAPATPSQLVPVWDGQS